MRIGIPFLFQCLIVNLFANFNDIQDDPVIAAMEGEPSVTINKSINPISGDYIISETDLIIPGYEPLYFNRTYLSSIQKGRNAYWSLLPHIYMYFTIPEHKGRDPVILTVSEPSGSTIRYKNLVANNGKDRKQFFPILGESTRGLTNTARGEIGARTNITHNHIFLDKAQDAYILTTCDGTQRYYKKPSHTSFAYLQKERKPNGNWVRYEYNEDFYTLKEIRTTNPQNTKIYAKVTFENKNPNPNNCKNFAVLTEKRDILHYFFRLDDVKNGKHNDHYFRLNCIIRPYLPEEKLVYGDSIDSEQSFLINKRFLDNHLIANVNHYKMGSNPTPAENITINKAEDPRLRRVKSIEEPVGPDGSLARTHYFTYNLGNYARDKKKNLKEHLDQRGFVYCYDVYNKKTEYAFNDFFVPLYTFKFGTDLNNPKTGQEQLVFEEHFGWRFDGCLNRLSYKYYKDQEKILSLKSFEYDAKGNVIEETFSGNLSGHNHGPVILPNTKIKNTADEYTIKNTYSNDRYSVITSKTLPNGRSYKYEYLPNTNLITATFTLCHGQIKIREFQVYNEDHVVIETIIDDGSSQDRDSLEGVTQRTIKTIQPKKDSPAINFPEVIEEKYLDLKTNTYRLLKKVVLHYSNESALTKEEVYDANNQHVYNITNGYDQKQRFVESIDPLGRHSFFNYNNFNHLTEEAIGNTSVKIIHSKDILGREFATTSIDCNGITKEIRTAYDLKSRVIQTIDPQGNTTQFSYDDLDHEFERILPATLDANQNIKRPLIKTINDIYGHPLSITDPLGHVTRFSYSALEKPISIIYPDNTQEHFYYNLDGTTREHHSVTELKTHFDYDCLGRITKKSVFSKRNMLLYEELFVYDSFKLLSHIDEKGVKTLYHYDDAGRKTQEIKSKDNEFIGHEEYFYDALGRHYKTIIHEDASSNNKQIYLKLFDHANRITEERQEDASGTLFSKVQYQYDSYDNTIAITNYIHENPVIETFTYDSYKRVTSYTDSEGNISHTHYNDRIYNPQTNSYDSEKIHVDPKGRQTKELYSSTNQLVSITFCNALGTIQAQEFFYYDLNGNKVKQLSKVFNGQELLREVITLWEYDSRNRVTTLIEASGNPLQKVSRFTYTADGKEKSVTQPNGITLEYTYDDLSRLTALKSSDNSVHYQFIYNKNGDLIEELNVLTQAKTLKTYNGKGDLLQETLANGLSIKKTYDSLGRKTSLTLHEGTRIDYDFDSFHLKKIAKYTPDETLHYEHNYLSYNLQHQPTEESSIFNLCNIIKTYDTLGRNTSIHSPYYSEHAEEFDTCGNLVKLHTQSDFNTTDSTYFYDELDHLTQEEGLSSHQYGFDSHHNRIIKDNLPYSTNTLNQLLQENSSSYEYNFNGNRSVKKANNRKLIYEYDALNRLICLKSDSIEILFTYDSWHRRLSKSIKKKSFFDYFETLYEELYLYDDEKEIASTDSSFKIQQLRILGLGKGSDIGAAVAIEIDNTVYAPFHDLLGNIVNLVHAEKNYVAESYRYSAFGECQIYNYYHFSIRESYINNPWRYQSKRTEDDSSLVFFGRRYYDPQVGTWLSPDPLGLTQGPSLYQFVLGNPFSNIDLYGLAASQRDDDETPLNTRPLTGSGFSTFSTPMDDNPYRDNPWLRAPQGYEPPARPSKPTHHPHLEFRFHEGSGFSSHQNYEFVFVNGIRTPLPEARDMAGSCSKNLGYNVNYFYNKTNGFKEDLKNVGNNHLRRPSHDVSALKYHLATQINKGKEIFLFGHSGGGGIMFNLLEQLPQSYRDKINVVTFGSAKYIPKEFGKTVVNYSSKRDWVSIGSNLWNLGLNYKEYRNAVSNPSIEVTWLKPQRWSSILKEHSFMGTTYQKALGTRCDFIKDKWGL